MFPKRAGVGVRPTLKTLMLLVVLEAGWMERISGQGSASLASPELLASPCICFRPSCPYRVPNRVMDRGTGPPAGMCPLSEGRWKTGLI